MQEEIVLRTQCGLMSITGENLSLSRYDRDVLVVLGLGCFMYKKYNTRFLYYV